MTCTRTCGTMFKASGLARRRVRLESHSAVSCCGRDARQQPKKLTATILQETRSTNERVTSVPLAPTHRVGSMAIEKLYTANEAAKALRLSKRTLLEYCRQSRISYVRLRGKFLFRESVLDIFIRRNSVPAKHLPSVSTA